MTHRTVWKLGKETFQEWRADKATRLAAAISYYASFSMAPLLITVVALASVFFEQDLLQAEIQRQLTVMIGEDSAELIETMLAGPNQEEKSIVASLLGIVALLAGATGVFAQLRDALNTAWEVAPRPGRGVKGLLESRVVSFGMVLVIAFLLLVSLVLSAVIASITESMRGAIVGGYFLQALSSFASLLIITVLFAMMFKYLPDAEIHWRDVWVGAAATALLFEVGKFAIAFYLGRSNLGSTYGSAAALAIFLVWIYYSAQILLLGAEFTQVYARHFGSRIRPDPDAVSTEPAVPSARVAPSESR